MVSQREFDNSFNDRGSIEYPSDCEKIQRVGLSMGLNMSMHQAQEVWQKFSDNRCAGWLNVDSYEEQDLREAIEIFVRRDET